MCNFRLRSSIFWGLVLSFLLVIVLGCRAEDTAAPPGSIRESAEPAPSSRSISPAPGPRAIYPVPSPRAISPAQTGKPLESSEDAEGCRPSQWRQKLRAKYA